MLIKFYRHCLSPSKDGLRLLRKILFYLISPAGSNGNVQNIIAVKNHRLIFLFPPPT